MKRILAICATAGALATAAPAFADTLYTNPSTGQTSVVPDQGYPGGPFGMIMAPVRMITAPLGMILQPASGAIGGATGMNVNLVPVNPNCHVQTDFNGKHTAVCGP